METPFGKKYLAVSRIKNPRTRGYRFQSLLQEFLLSCRFDVNANPGCAKPRQTDISASYDDLHLLIEAKWESKKLDVSDIDDLRSRLRRVAPHVVGCIFSMSCYTHQAIQEVEQDRTREILLCNADELEECFLNGKGLLDLLKYKRKMLAIHGRVWFLSEGRERDLKPRVNLPRTSLVFSSSKKSIVCRPVGDFPEKVVFTHRMPKSLFENDNKISVTITCTLCRN
jgi:hypothetical protein